MAETWVRWWRDGYIDPYDSKWSKWHHVMDDHPAGPLPCRPAGFQIPEGAEYRDGRPPPADACAPCVRRLARRQPPPAP